MDRQAGFSVEEVAEFFAFTDRFDADDFEGGITFGDLDKFVKGFALADVGPEVYLWNGALDWSHPIAMVEHHVRELPRVRSVVVPDVGALGYMECLPAILADMLPGPGSPIRTVGSD